MKRVLLGFTLVVLVLSLTAVCALADAVSVVVGGGSEVPAVGVAAAAVHEHGWSHRVASDGYLYVAEEERSEDSVYYGFFRVNGSGNIDRVVQFPEIQDYPDDLTVDRDGNVYLVLYHTYQVLKVRPDGQTELIGNGIGETAGDGLPATDPAVSLTKVQSLATDLAGNLYIGTVGVIRKVSANGVISTRYADPALGMIHSIWADGHENIYFCGNDSVLRRLSSTATAPATLFAGRIRGIAGDQWGNVYVSSPDDVKTLKRIDPKGAVTTLLSWPDGSSEVSRISVDRDGFLSFTVWSDPALVEMLRFTPVLSTMAPTTGAAGTRVVLTGRYFASNGAKGKVTFTDTKGGAVLSAPIIDWSNEAVVISAPTMVSRHSYNVVVVAPDGQKSSALLYKAP